MGAALKLLAKVEASVARAVASDDGTYAYDQKLGYLASCPSDLGCSLRASVRVYYLFELMS